MRIFVLLTVAALLAGCASPAPPSDDEEMDSSDMEGPRPSDPDGPESAATSSGTAPAVIGARLPETTVWNDTIDLTLPYGVPYAPYDQQDPRRFALDGNTTAVLVEVAWDDPAMDLNAYAIPDRCPDIGAQTDVECEVGVTTRTSHWYEDRGGGPGAGDSPSILLLDRALLVAECLPCEWTFGAHAESAAAQVTATIAVTLFFGEVPPGFSALP